jgi:hypothetical protein
VIDRIGEVVKNGCYLGPIALFLGAENEYFWNNNINISI